MGMDGYIAYDCTGCDGQGVLFEDDGTEPECPDCEGEGIVYQETK